MVATAGAAVVDAAVGAAVVGDAIGATVVETAVVEPVFLLMVRTPVTLPGLLVLYLLQPCRRNPVVVRGEVSWTLSLQSPQ